MKLCELSEMKIADEDDWSEFEEHWYCKKCQKVFHVMAKGKRNPGICSECLEEMTQITDVMIEKSKAIKKQGCLKFTDAERKEIFNDWRKSIKKIPTWEAILKRQERQKRPHQTFASA